MQLVWADRNGNESGTIGKPADYDPGSSRLSRDGRKLLTARRQRGLGGYDIWRLDLDRGTEEQLTSGRGSEVTPVWIDGERSIIFAGDSAGSLPHLFRRDLATGSEKELLPPGSQQLVMDVLPGGGAVVYAERQVAGRLQDLPTAADGGCIARSSAATAVQLVWDARVARWPRDGIPSRTRRGRPLCRTVSRIRRAEPSLAGDGSLERTTLERR